MRCHSTSSHSRHQDSRRSSSFTSEQRRPLSCSTSCGFSPSLSLILVIGLTGPSWHMSCIGNAGVAARLYVQLGKVKFGLGIAQFLCFEILGSELIDNLDGWEKLICSSQNTTKFEYSFNDIAPRFDVSRWILINIERLNAVRTGSGTGSFLRNYLPVEPAKSGERRKGKWGRQTTTTSDTTLAHPNQQGSISLASEALDRLGNKKVGTANQARGSWVLVSVRYV